jgi:hypothetical protein
MVRILPGVRYVHLHRVGFRGFATLRTQKCFRELGLDYIPFFWRLCWFWTLTHLQRLPLSLVVVAILVTQ